MDVEATADNLARGQFGIRQEITVQSGQATPQTNMTSKPFDPKQYEEDRQFWATNLANIKYLLIFKPNGSGEISSYDPEKKKRSAGALKWTLHGSDLILEYLDERRYRTDTARLVSTNDLYYPMEPLGGWIVMHPQNQTRSRR
jgi:hypothetical protein